MQYAYGTHRRGLHTAKQDRAIYGEELDVTVEYIRQRGLNTRRIDAIVVSPSELQENERRDVSALQT